MSRKFNLKPTRSSSMSSSEDRVRPEPRFLPKNALQLRYEKFCNEAADILEPRPPFPVKIPTHGMPRGMVNGAIDFLEDLCFSVLDRDYKGGDYIVVTNWTFKSKLYLATVQQDRCTDVFEYVKETNEKS